MSAARRLAILGAILLSVALLYPGVTQPVMTLSGTVEKSTLAQLGLEMLAGDEEGGQARQMLATISSLMGLDQIEGQVQAYHSTRSIWGTAEELARTGNLLVAILIVLFSVVIPVFKLGLQGVSLFVAEAGLRGPLMRFNSYLSKWSMADVFVMGLLVAYMAGSASSEMGGLLTMHAQLEAGFYWFLAYCLSSIAVSAALAEPAKA